MTSSAADQAPPLPTTTSYGSSGSGSSGSGVIAAGVGSSSIGSSPRENGGSRRASRVDSIQGGILNSSVAEGVEEGASVGPEGVQEKGGFFG